LTSEELQERFISFGADVGLVADALPDSRLGRHIAGQIVRCGTSPAANYAEACAGQSRPDFIHKMAIVLKELRETHVWLRMMVRARLLPEQKVTAVRQECHELISIVTASLITARANKNKPTNEVAANRAHSQSQI
jgi:four helix bundle protein